MTISVKPTLRTTAEEIRASEETGRNRKIPGLVEALEQHASAVRVIDDLPYIPAEKAKRIAAAEAELHTKVSDAIAAATRSQVRDLDQQAGQLRASLSTASPQDRMASDLRASNLSAQIASAPLRDLDGLFADAQLAGDDGVTRTVGYAVLKRLDDAKDADKGKPVSAARDAYLQFQQRFEQWQRQHPTVAQRLAQIEREKANIVTAIQQSAAFALRMFRVGPHAPERPPAPAADPRLKVGSAFDLLGDPRARR